MKKVYLFLTLLIGLMSCSDFDEQEFTVLLPNAGVDQVLFTEETGTTIQLDASSSSDVNNLGFEYQWNILSSPDGFPITLSDPTIANPTFEVSNDASGRYAFSVALSIGDQVAVDFVNVDVNPALAEILFFNAIDSEETAILRVPALDVVENPVAFKNTSDAYLSVDTNVSVQEDGTTLLEVDYNGTTLSINENIEALKSYTLYLVGTTDAPELLLVEKINNQKTIPIGLVGLDAVNLVPETNDVVLFIDATAFGIGVIPIDALFGVIGLPEQFGSLSYQDNAEILFPSTRIAAIPIWATIAGERISNDSSIGLTAGVDANFGTFVLVQDASSEFGQTFLFVDNSSLLPQ